MLKKAHQKKKSGKVDSLRSNTFPDFLFFRTEGPDPNVRTSFHDIC